MWYSFTANSQKQMILINADTTNHPVIGMDIYSGICGSLILVQTNTGIGYSGMIVNNLTTNTTYFVKVHLPNNAALPLTVNNFTNKSAGTGALNSIYLCPNGSVFVGGENGSGQYGNGTTSGAYNAVLSLVPIPIATAVAEGNQFSMALCNGKVYVWGINFGANPTILVNALNVQITGITAIAANGQTGLALDINGHVWSFGDNWFGQLGIGTQGAPVTFANEVLDQNALLPLSNIIAIDGGNQHCMALQEVFVGSGLGQLFSWGDGASGQLGVNTGFFPSLLPIQESHLWTDIKLISGGDEFSIILRNNGFVYSTGLNDFHYILGNGFTSPSLNQYTPAGAVNTVVASIFPAVQITAISAGLWHSLALLSNGSVLSWGENVSNSGGGGNSWIGLIPGVNCVSSISAGYQCSIATQSNGAELAWGLSGSPFGFTPQYAEDPNLVPLPCIPSSIINSTICLGQSTILTGSGIGTFNWSVNGNTISTSSTVTVSPVTTTTYTFTNGCGQSYSYIVTVNQFCPCSITNFNYTVPANTTVNSTILFNGNNFIGFPNVININIQDYATLNIDNTLLLTLSGCNIVMGVNAKITLTGNGTGQAGDLEINKQTHIYSCSDMWDGIYVYAGRTLTIDGNSIIEDATHAIVSIGGGNYAVSNSIFNRNYTTIEVQAFGFYAHPGTINSTIITCRDLSSVISAALINNPTQSTGTHHLILSSYSYCGLKPHIPAYCSTLKSAYGIFATDVRLLNIGNATNATYNNVFDNIGTGINLIRTSAYIYNNTFQNMVKPSSPWVCNYNLANTAINAIGAATGPYYINVGSGTAPNFYSNTFTNVYTGIFVKNYQGNFIVNNIFTNGNNTNFTIGNFGIEVIPAGGNKIEINYNNITNFNNAIWVNRSVYNGAITNIQNSHIETNYIYGNVSGGVCSQAIYFTDGSSNNTASPFPIKIELNTISQVQNGITAIGVRGGLTIEANNGITLLTATSTAKGIELDNCFRATVAKNMYIHSFNGIGAANPNYYGIYVNYSPQSSVLCNSIINIGQSMTFKYLCLPSYVYNNNMSNGIYGLVLDVNGQIGIQSPGSTGMVVGIASGNTWSGFSLYDTYTTNSSNAQLSELFVNPGAPNVPTPNFTAGGIAYSTGNSSINVFGTAVATYNCASVPIVPYFPILTPSQLKSLAYDSTQYEQYEEQLKYFGQIAAYDVLDSTDALSHDTTGLLHSFYDSAKVANMGLLKDVGKYIAANNYSAANTKNAQVYPNNTVEANQKAINYYYLLSLMDSTYQYSSTDSSAIYAIAAQCPTEAGTAVWEARVLYYTIINNIIDFEDNCEAIGKSLNHKGNKSIIKVSDNFKLYPNPNDGNMTLEYHIQDNDIATVSIYDLTGRMIKLYPLNTKSTKLDINENELGSGIYYYNIRVNEKLYQTNKIVIIK